MKAELIEEAREFANGLPLGDFDLPAALVAFAEKVLAERVGWIPSDTPEGTYLVTIKDSRNGLTATFLDRYFYEAGWVKFDTDNPCVIIAHRERPAPYQPDGEKE